jgi:hypothetical protein
MKIIILILLTNVPIPAVKIAIHRYDLDILGYPIKRKKKQAEALVPVELTFNNPIISLRELPSLSADIIFLKWSELHF